MTRYSILVLVVMVACLVTGSSLQTADAAPKIETIALWPDGHDALAGLDAKNIPSLAIYKPAAPVKAVPVIMIVCPGGGYGGLTMGD